MADGAIRAPRSLGEAQRLCEAFAALDGAIAAREGARDAAIAELNVAADAELGPLLARRAAVRDKLEGWFLAKGGELTGRGRKSGELGGCVLGVRAGRASLIVPGDEAAAREALAARKWGKALLRVTVALDKTAILRALNGRQGNELTAMGFGQGGGEPVFFITRTAQAGTQAKAGA